MKGNEMKQERKQTEAETKAIYEDTIESHKLKQRSLMRYGTNYLRLNGFPVLTAGTFTYYGYEIDPHYQLGLWDESEYTVLRTEKALRNKTLVRSFDGIPLVFHQCHNDLRAVKYDPKHRVFFQREGGTFGCTVNPRYDKAKRSILVDVVIWDKNVYEVLKAQQAVKLTAGYNVRYEQQYGTVGGKRYEFLQTPMEADHVNFTIKVRGEKAREGEKLRAIPSGNMQEDITPCLTAGNAENAATGTKTDCAISQTSNATTSLAPDASTTWTRKHTTTSQAKDTSTMRTSGRGNTASDEKSKIALAKRTRKMV